MFLQIASSLPSERRVSLRTSTMSIGERPVNGFLLVAVSGGGGVKSTVLKFLVPGVTSLR